MGYSDPVRPNDRPEPRPLHEGWPRPLPEPDTESWIRRESASGHGWVWVYVAVLVLMVVVALFAVLPVGDTAPPVEVRTTTVEVDGHTLVCAIGDTWSSMDCEFVPEMP